MGHPPALFQDSVTHQSQQSSLRVKPFCCAPGRLPETETTAVLQIPVPHRRPSPQESHRCTSFRGELSQLRSPRIRAWPAFTRENNLLVSALRRREVRKQDRAGEGVEQGSWLGTGSSSVPGAIVQTAQSRRQAASSWSVPGQPLALTAEESDRSGAVSPSNGLGFK